MSVSARSTNYFKERRALVRFTRALSLPSRRDNFCLVVSAKKQSAQACCVLCGLSNPGKAAPLLATAIARLLATFRRARTGPKKCHTLAPSRLHS